MLLYWKDIMPIKLAEIDRLMPDKHISNNCDCEDGEGCRQYRLSPEDEGWDKAIDQLGSRSIGINRERLAKSIFEYEMNLTNNIYAKWHDMLSKKAWFNKADAIIAKEKEIIEYKEGKSL